MILYDIILCKQAADKPAAGPEAKSGKGKGKAQDRLLLSAY